jgi:hypothetical protein
MKKEGRAGIWGGGGKKRKVMLALVNITVFQKEQADVMVSFFLFLFFLWGGGERINK